MKISAVFFDLDGTLLPMDFDVFVKSYFGSLAKKLAPLGYEPEKLISSIWTGTRAMIQNDGSCTNEQAFWESFCHIYGPQAKNDMKYFDEFYRQEFQAVQGVCGFAPEAGEVIALLKRKNVPMVLATNPLFPAVATHSRIGWAGLKGEDFQYITTYENSHFCKPNPAYYREILTTLQLKPEECLMVGNDVQEDMVAQTLGMQVFLLTPCLIDRMDTDLNCYPHGDFHTLMDFLSNIL